MITQRETSEYWKDKDVKKWVVVLSSPKGNSRIFVSAKTLDGAIKTARQNSNLKGGISAKARLARPCDLGISA